MLLLGGICIGAYAYFTDRARLTTEPQFKNLAAQFSGNTIIYPGEPPVALTFVPEFNYVGGQEFTLYGSAEVEQHFFVEENDDETARSIFWIQFENVLAGQNWAYDYSSQPLRIEIDDVTFLSDTAAGVRNGIFEFGAPGTDGYHARKYLANMGYRVPKNFAFARLVYLPTPDRRREVLIIQFDDLGPTGMSGASLQAGGANEAKWPEVTYAHIAKIKRVMSVNILE